MNVFNDKVDLVKCLQELFNLKAAFKEVFSSSDGARLKINTQMNRT